MTIFPDVIRAYMAEGIMRLAAEKGLINLDVMDLRDFTTDRHRTVDDTPYGGGPGMVMKPEPFEKAIQHVRADGAATRIIMPSPAGKPFTQADAERLSGSGQRLLFLCGRYEDIDARVAGVYADEEISLGDYVLSGGELPALVIIDAVVRLLPGAVGDENSLSEESFSWGILDYPQYTRPAEWGGLRVPEVLMGGHHAEIARWRRKEALRRTLSRRPDLVEGADLSEIDRELIDEIEEEG